MPITDGPHTTPELFDEGIPFASAEAISCGNGKIDFTHIRGYISQEFYEECCKKYIPQVNDILMIKSGATTGKVSMVDTNKVFTIWSPLAAFRCNSSTFPKFLFYYLQSEAFQKQVEFGWTYGTQQNIGMRTLEQLKVVYPPFAEQKKISDYLDHQCAAIDAVLEKTRASIEEYKKLKQAVITEAVTKGIRGDRPMKDSGIAWIGEIPEEWGIQRGKRLFVETNERSETGKEELLTVSHITGVTPRSQKNVNMFMSESLVGYKICHVNDLAANTMWMWQGAIGVSKYEGVISPSYNTYRQISGAYDSTFLEYLLRIPSLVATYSAYSTGITASRLRLYPDQFFSIMFPVPPMDEQIEIVEYLSNKIPKMDGLIAKKEQFLTELETYKKSLIYEVVTGKREVLS
jgi:type I restriction enzyme S subunit